MEQPFAQDLYTKRATAYLRFVSAMRYPQALRAVLRDFEPLRSDMKVLDAGCGSGLLTLALRSALAARGLRPGVTHGFDLTPAMLDRFRATIAERDLHGIELCEANVLDLDPLPDSWRDYDLVVSSGMLEYLPRRELPAALRGLGLRLAEGGCLLFWMSKRNWMNRLLMAKWWDAQLYSREELRGCVAEAGFSDIRFRSFPRAYRQMALWGHIVEARR